MIHTAARNQIIHSRNPYLHKYCGCIHLRVGCAFSCLIWAGFSLYLCILAFQNKSRKVDLQLYVFAVINLLMFGTSLGTFIAVYRSSAHRMGSIALIVYMNIFLVLTDMTALTVLFIVRRSTYVDWCISTTSIPLEEELRKAYLDHNRQDFTFNMGDFYNCNRTWENELKFTVLFNLLMIFLYTYWGVCIHSYIIKIRSRIRVNCLSHMDPNDPGMMMPPMPMMHPNMMNNGETTLHNMTSSNKQFMSQSTYPTTNTELVVY
ncbi:hypothetical protein BDB01DRAFT_724891 [Pilobolus umbonatus]|nr:hypothetical protein BDB01DRAFT_724891 [Pilobolus umbonatus]